ncbi:hypothetical protein, partial [Escherichia coli]|uniref:hypothetical protein n=1 Tax=Escherichia coli TaxID=562 RepID=UPI0012C8FE6B|nr:hypothetical protein [Escherichia coli]
LKKYNVYLQIKGPDSFAHKGKYKEKIKSIEAIDKFFLMPLIKRCLGKDILLVLTCDHITSSKHQSHYKGNTTFIKAYMKNIKKIEIAKIKFCEK